jgi:Ca-activated chloride channel homolog
MNWSKEFSSTELFFIIAFFLIYTIYFVRVIIIARKLKTTANSVAIKFLLRTLYMALLILGLLGPNFGITEIEARSTSKEIYLAFDLSTSMNANDVEPSRLDKAKSEFIALIDQYKSDKIGIMIFNGQANLYTPLTYDQEIIKNNITGLKTNLIKTSGTNINALLELAYEKFGNDQKSNNHSKICIVATDGENFEPIDYKWKAVFKKLNVNLYYIGIGTSVGSRIPVINGYKKDKNGNEIISILDIKQLAEISNKTGGNYYLVNNQKNQMSGLIDAINLLKKVNQTTNQQIVTNNKYVYFLLLALFFIFIDFLLSINILKL